MAADAYTIINRGKTITTGASSTSTTLPTASNGTAAKYCRIVCTGQAYVAVGNSSVTAAAGDMLIQNADGVIIRTLGNTHIAAIQVGTSSVVQVSPLEDQ